jgi:hypothetical protein
MLISRTGLIMKQGFTPPVPPPLPNDRSFTYEPPGRRKPSMLAWWAVFPLAGFLVVEAVYGWGIAVKRATAPDLAVSYLCGSVIGGLLISLGVAWVTYRVGSRSRYAATLAFTGVMLLCCGGVFRQAREMARLHEGGPSGDATATQRHEFADFSFETAGDWREAQSPKQKTLAFVVLPDGAGTQPRGMIMVDAGKPTSDVRQTASRLAPDGRVLPDPVRVGGVEGVRVESPSTDLSRPKVAVVLVRDQRMYLIMAANAGGYDVTPDFDQVLETWKWREDATIPSH